MIIDSHHHLWQYNPREYDWIDGTMTAIAKDFLPASLSQTLGENDVQGAITVQARQSLEETRWLLSLAEQHDEMLGVVGWIDLKADDLEVQLAEFIEHPKLVGFRHVIQGESDPKFMQDPSFIRGLKLLAKHQIPYDLLILSHQLSAAIEMLKAVPELRVVIDHIAKPDIKSNSDMQTWAEQIKIIAQLPNVSCKLSGMVTEADWQHWQGHHFTPYLDIIFQAFGADRLMYGSDWPVCLIAANYSQVKSIVSDYIQHLPKDQQQQIMATNAMNFYQLT